MNKREFRPPFEKALTKNIQLLDDQRGIISLTEFQGSIWVAYCTSSQDENQNLTIQNKVKRLRAKFPEEAIKACVFVVDATTEEAEKLSAYRTAHGEDFTDNDYIIAANVEVLKKYLKNEFRFSLYPYEKDGKWIYDQDLILLDRMPTSEDGVGAVLAHLRGHLDFTKAIELDEEAMRNHAKTAPYEEQLNQVMVDSIRYFIENPNEEDAALSGEKE